MTNEDYPYKGEDGMCKFIYYKGMGYIDDYWNIAPLNVAQLKAAVMLNPIAITIEADTIQFFGYVSGVITGKDCGDVSDHAVLIVGYGTDPAT